MQQAILGNAYWKVITLQALGTGFCTILAFVLGDQKTAFSAFFGGASVLVGNLVYAFLARASALYAKSGNVVLLRHMLAEVAKVLIVLGLVYSALASEMFAAGWLVAAMVVALMCQWLAWLVYK